MDVCILSEIVHSLLDKRTAFERLLLCLRHFWSSAIEYLKEICSFGSHALMNICLQNIHYNDRMKSEGNESRLYEH